MPISLASHFIGSLEMMHQVLKSSLAIYESVLVIAM